MASLARKATARPDRPTLGDQLGTMIKSKTLAPAAFREFDALSRHLRPLFMLT